MGYVNCLRSRYEVAKSRSRQYNLLKHDNPLSKIRTYEFTDDVVLPYGRVAGGTGYQTYIPKKIDPSDILKFLEETDLR